MVYKRPYTEDGDNVNERNLVNKFIPDEEELSEFMKNDDCFRFLLKVLFDARRLSEEERYLALKELFNKCLDKEGLRLLYMAITLGAMVGFAETEYLAAERYKEFI